MAPSLTPVTPGTLTLTVAAGGTLTLTFVTPSTVILTPTGTTPAARTLVTTPILFTTTLSGAVSKAGQLVTGIITERTVITGAVSRSGVALIVPGALTEPMTLSGAVLFRRIEGGQLTETMTLTGGVSKQNHKTIAPAQITDTMTLAGSVRALRRIVTAAITETMTLAGSITTATFPKILPAQITETMTLAGAVRALRRVLLAQIIETMTVAGSVKPLRRVLPAQITETMTLGGSVRRRRRIQPAQIPDTMTVTGAVSSAVGNVTPPAAPAAYSLPGTYTLVANTAQLNAAIGASAANIVCANGTYDNGATYFSPGTSSIYAQNLGGAVFTSGLQTNQSNVTYQGLAFNISSVAKTLNGGCVHHWGAGTNLTVKDCTFNGNSTVTYGILDYAPTGLTAQRLTFLNFTDVALRASNNTVVAYHDATPTITTITDINIDGVTRTPPGASNGTAEAGLWVGHPVTNPVARVKIRNVAWAGLETVNNSWDTTFTDLDIDMGGVNSYAGVGVYMEHFTRFDTFTRFTLARCNTGFNGEWNEGVAGNAGAHFVTIQNGIINALNASNTGNKAGVYLDEGSESTTVTNVTFLNQNWAGIGAYLNIGTNSFTNNTFQLAPGGVPTRTTHI